MAATTTQQRAQEVGPISPTSGSVFPESSLHPTGVPDGVAERILRSMYEQSRKTLLPQTNPSLLTLFSTHITSLPGVGLQEAALPLEKQLND